ncbi:MAG: hypothetical protein CMJ46_06270 [Planctomyces sp.]|nr:hypothetical protein [Planctomyces sp.]
MKVLKNRSFRKFLVFVLLLGLLLTSYVVWLTYQAWGRAEFATNHEWEFYALRKNPEEADEHSAYQQAHTWLLDSLASMFDTESLSVVSPTDVGVETRAAFEGVTRYFDLTEVKELSIDSEETDPIANRDLKLLQHFPAVTSLSIRGISLDEESFQYIGQLSHLSQLNINDTYLDGTELRFLRNCASLRELYHGRVRDPNAFWKELIQLPRLEVCFGCDITITDDMLLQLDTELNWRRLPSAFREHLDITDAGMAQLKYLTNVESLDLRHCDISDDSLAVLSAVPDLRRLTLSHTPIRDDGLAHLADHPNLERLHLRNTRITDVAIATLNTMPRLYEVDLGQTEISDEGIAALSLPITQEESVSQSESRSRNDDSAERVVDPRINRRPLLLYLDRTRVTDATIPHLNQIPLLLLTIGGTRISADGIRSLDLDPRADKLSLRGLTFEKDDIAHLFKRTEIYELDLAYSSVDDACLELIDELHECDTLDLSGTKVTHEGLAQLATFSGEKHLEDHNVTIFRYLGYLKLNDRPLTRQDINTLSQFEELPILLLNNAKIDDDRAAQLMPLHLKDLHLDDNPITDEGMTLLLNKGVTTIHAANTNITADSFRDYNPSDLRRLLIPDTRVTDDIIPCLTARPWLEHLDISGTLITDAGREALFTRFPDSDSSDRTHWFALSPAELPLE